MEPASKVLREISSDLIDISDPVNAQLLIKPWSWQTPYIQEAMIEIHLESTPTFIDATDVRHNSSAGTLEALPLELLHYGLSYLDFMSLYSLLRTSTRARLIVESLPAYREIVSHACEALAALTRRSSSALIPPQLSTRCCGPSRALYAGDMGPSCTFCSADVAASTVSRMLALFASSILIKQQWLTACHWRRLERFPSFTASLRNIVCLSPVIMRTAWSLSTREWRKSWESRSTVPRPRWWNTPRRSMPRRSMPRRNMLKEFTSCGTKLARRTVRRMILPQCHRRRL